MEEKDYPNYFIAGDRASLEAQKKYVYLSRVGLIITFIASLITIYEFENISYKVYILCNFNFILFSFYSFNNIKRI